MPAMTPAEAASALVLKTKERSPKVGMEENIGVGDDAVTLEEFIMTQNGDDLLASQDEKDGGVQKRRNPDRGAKIGQPTIPESQVEEMKSPKKKGLDKSDKGDRDKNIASKGATARAAVCTAHLSQLPHPNCLTSSQHFKPQGKTKTTRR
jgi:hypothetical protein